MSVCLCVLPKLHVQVSERVKSTYTLIYVSLCLDYMSPGYAPRLCWKIQLQSFAPHSCPAMYMSVQSYAAYTGFRRGTGSFSRQQSLSENASMTSLLPTYRNSVYRWKMSQIVLHGCGLQLCVNWMSTCTMPRVQTLIGQRKLFAYYVFTVWEQSLIYARTTAQPLIKHVPAVTEHFSVRTAMYTVRLRCGISAILAPSTV